MNTRAHITALTVLLMFCATAACAIVTPAELDRCVEAHLSQSKLALPPACEDAVFLRRVSLDLTGRIPAPDAARAFLDNPRSDKRRILIDTLLASPEYADYQTLHWLDLLRVKSEFPANLWPNAVQVYSRWIRSNVATNQPYDAFARDLLTANGSNFRDPAVNFFRALPHKDATNIAAFVAQSLMGTRFGTLPPNEQADLAHFFCAVGYKATTEWKEEIVFFNPAQLDARPFALRFSDGRTATCAPNTDPRLLFAAWLTAPGNPFFARCAVNRIWFYLMGRGIVHEADDLRADNPPANPALLALLEKALTENRFDLRALYRLILNSQTYQAQASAPPETLMRRTGYAFYQIRQLDAEVLLDIICQITGTTESYSSQIPEPYTNFTESRSICIGDGSVTSPFLEMFGRPPRDTGLLSERANWPSTSQRLHLLNASHIQNKLLQVPAFRPFKKKHEKRDPQQSRPLDELYLLALSRYPTTDERLVAHTYMQTSGGPSVTVLQDLLWALINTKEFCVRR